MYLVHYRLQQDYSRLQFWPVAGGGKDGRFQKSPLDL
jgi:hypothetical protein